MTPQWRLVAGIYLWPLLTAALIVGAFALGTVLEGPGLVLACVLIGMAVGWLGHATIESIYRP